MNTQNEPAEREPRKRSWLAELDRPFYVADGRQPRHRGRALILTAVLGIVLVVGITFITRATGAAGWLILTAGAVVFLVVYILWRRRRNREMTGSPTRWPDSDL